MFLPVPSYTFITSGGQRRFVHRWHLNNNEIIECNKCGRTSCKDSDDYAMHWQKPKMGIVEDCNSSGCSSKSLMDLKQLMFNKNIESFMLCDTKLQSNTRQFLLDTGIKAIPDLLCLMYEQAQRLDISHCLGLTLRFYVEIKKDLYSLQSTELLIKHHYDIRESVDMIFAMLLEKLSTFMATTQYEVQDYTIKRLYVRIRKQRCHQKGGCHLTLPLQYVRKQQDHYETMTSPQPKNLHPHMGDDLLKLTACYEKYLHTSGHRRFQPPFPCNLYNFQVCENSLELYTVPYYMSTSVENVATCRNFIILNDIGGNFTELQEIWNIKRFLHHSMEDRVMTCSQCGMNFNETNKLIIHKMLNCGHNFEIKKINSDIIEIYENCLLLKKCEEYTLYGLME